MLDLESSGCAEATLEEHRTMSLVLPVTSGQSPWWSGLMNKYIHLHLLSYFLTYLLLCAHKGCLLSCDYLGTKSHLLFGRQPLRCPSVPHLLEFMALCKPLLLSVGWT